jgi:hypothetical protein
MLGKFWIAEQLVASQVGLSRLELGSLWFLRWLNKGVRTLQALVMFHLNNSTEVNYSKQVVHGPDFVRKEKQSSSVENDYDDDNENG